MRALAVALVLSGATALAGGGRVPATNRIEFRDGQPNDILAGTTFGMLVSHDSGATWHYMCPAAFHAGGAYDPDYAYGSNGMIAATSFDGVAIMRDGCSFGPTPLHAAFASQLELDRVGGLDVALADPMASSFAHSPDDGLNFPFTTPIGIANDYWSSLLVSPAGDRIYISGRRGLEVADSILLLESHDFGHTFAPMAATFLVTTSTSIVNFVALDPQMPERLYARVDEPSTSHYDFFVSNDAGATWAPLTSVIDQEGPPSLLLRANGELVLGTHSQGMQGSTNQGATWEPLPCPLHIGCLAESPAGEVWACTQNYDSVNVPGDGFAIMRSTDLATWTAVLQLHDIVGPVACPAGTIQHDQCVSAWADLVPALPATTRVPACVVLPPDGPTVDAIGAEAPGPLHGHVDDGCCSSDGGRGNAFSLLVVLFAYTRRRRNHKV